MRHEMAVQLTEHPIRRAIVERGLSEHTLQSIRFNQQDIEDYWIQKDDYDWPEHWDARRKILALYCANSEFQLVKYLAWINHNCTGELPPMDIVMNYVCGVLPQ